MSNDGYCEVDFADASDDADPVEFCEHRTVTARKAHVCSECGGPIAVGEQYRKVAYKFDGEFGEDKVCGPCQETAGEFSYHIVGGSLWLMMQEEWDNGAHVQACINRLSTARAKAHMQQQWVKWRDRRMRQSQKAAQRKTQQTNAIDPSADTQDG